MEFASSAAARATGCSTSSPPTPAAGAWSPGRSKPPRSGISRCRCWVRARGDPWGTPERHSNGRFPSSATIRSGTIAGTRSTVDSRTTWRVAVGDVLAPGTGRLENLWDEDAVAGLDLGADQPPPRLRRSAGASATAEASAKAADPLRLLRYRSNLLGADLRITNFAGGNTSAKFDRPDPLTGDMTRVLAVKGSGGDLGSIDESGFAVLRLDALERLVSRYRGEAYED